MSEGFTAIFSFGMVIGMFVGGFITGVAINEGIFKGQHTDDYHSIDFIPRGDRDRSGDNRRDKRLEAEKAVIEHAKRLGVKIGGDK